MVPGFVMVAIAAASWGTWSLFLRNSGLPATVASPFIYLVMGLVTLPLALRGPGPRWDRATLLLLLAHAACDALNLVTFFAAIERTTVAIAVLTHYVAPIFVAIAAPWIDRTPARGVAPAAFVALAGLVIVLEPWRAASAGATAGAILGVISATWYAVNVFALRRLVERIGAPRAMSYHSLIAALALAPFALTRTELIAPAAVLWVSAGAASIGALSGMMFSLGLVRIGAARAAVLTFAEPLVAVAVGALVWEEALHPLAGLGGAMVLGAGIHVARKAR